MKIFMPMETSPELLNDAIKKEADEILYEKGLLQILNEFGQPRIAGSYSFDLMSWRDLDIYLETEMMAEENHFLLGGKIAACFHPLKMSFRNELIGKTRGLPAGLYWGVYLGDERKGAWKIDIWVVNKEECERLMKYSSEIEKRLTPETRTYIMEIKSQCWQDPRYRKEYTSSDIYEAVLKHKVSTLSGFKKYLVSKTN
jgi:hypothetical protein